MKARAFQPTPSGSLESPSSTTPGSSHSSHSSHSVASPLSMRPSQPSQPSRPPPPASAGAPRYGFGDIVGESAALLSAVRIARSASTNDLPVLLRGESGVGKEVFAQAIHAGSHRAHAPFIAVNCAALPRELLESELFGYAPGSFTGGRREGGIGKFEAANRGTLFLDEIGELSQGAQAALLRVLQEREITRVGESQARPVDVRIIAATQSATRNDALRTDVYYRLAVLVCDVPPLRERSDDVPMLVEQFLEDACLELRRGPLTIAPAVFRILAKHDWPGNVRELKNLIRRLVALNVDDHIDVDELPTDVRGHHACGERWGREHRDAHESRENHDTTGSTEASQGPHSVDGDEDAHFKAVLACARSASDAARALGIARSTLYRRMKRHGVEVQHTFQPTTPSEKKDKPD